MRRNVSWIRAIHAIAATDWERPINGGRRRTMSPRLKLRIPVSWTAIVFMMKIRRLAKLSLPALASLPLLAQSPGGTAANEPPGAAAPVLRFDAADVHRSPYMSDPWLDGPHLEGDRYVIYQATMADLIANAYSVDKANVQGGPSWLEFNRYDIEAKTASSTSGANQKLMLQALLAQRFTLAVHNGTAPMPAYVLRVGKERPKLKPSDGTADGRCDPQPRATTTDEYSFSCHNETMEQLAQLLRNTRGGGYLDKPVVDSTGLKGSFDFDLKWTPSGARGASGSISIFDALESQLGLKLALETAPRPVLIVDNVNEAPIPNPQGTEKSLPPLPLPEFEVAVVTPSKPDTRPWGTFGRGRLEVKGMTLRDLITVTWDLSDSNKQVIANEPEWLNKDRWDMAAKWSNEGDETANRPPNSDFRQFQQMMRALLAERFGLRAHIEDRPGDAYSLVAVNPKLTLADPQSRTRCAEGPGPDGIDPRMGNPVLNRLVNCQNITMAQFGEQLQAFANGYIYNTVLDKTGLKGGYNFTLSFSSVNNILNGGAPPSDTAQQGASEETAPDPNGAVSLFDAVRRELGLKLDKERRPVPVLVIDQIHETPTPN
jgi:uncharacterized protein (TIGR03435 family)